MKFLKFKLFSLAAIALLIMAGCDIGGDEERVCFQTVYAPATEVTGPETAVVNQVVNYAVKFRITNSCGSYYNFAVSSGFPKQVAAVVNYDGCDCTNQTTTLTKTYQFTPSQPGSYEFKFLSANDTYITKTLTVTEL